MKAIIIIDPCKRRKLFLMRASKKVAKWIKEDYDVEMIELGVYE